jgi:hypothetical protein
MMPTGRQQPLRLGCRARLQRNIWLKRIQHIFSGRRRSVNYKLLYRAN